MACNCIDCSRWTIGIISASILIFSIVFFVEFGQILSKKDWFKPIRNNCLPFYLVILAVACMIIYSILGLILCFAKKQVLCTIYLVIVILVIALKALTIFLTLYYKDQIFHTIENKWYNHDYINYRNQFENIYKCCGFTSYNPEYNCSYTSSNYFLCGKFVESSLNNYLNELRGVCIYLIVIDLFPTIFASVLTCCNDDGKAEEFENKDFESISSLYNSLIDY